MLIELCKTFHSVIDNDNQISVLCHATSLKESIAWQTCKHLLFECYRQTPGWKEDTLDGPMGEEEMWWRCEYRGLENCKSVGEEQATIAALCVVEWRTILTYSMVQSPSWEANWFAASQEIPRISRNPKVHYCTHKRPPPVPVLGQPNPVHIHTSHLLEIHPNIIHPSTPRSPQWSLSLRFPHQDPIHTPFLTHTRHVPSPSHSSRFYHPHNIGWGVQII